MAITTLDGALAGRLPLMPVSKPAQANLVAGTPRSLWPAAGFPVAGGYDTTLNGVALTAPVTGQIPWNDPVGVNAYLARLVWANLNAGQLLLCDRLWHNGGFTITSTAAQTIVSPAFPARDVAGSSNGDGVLLGLEISAAAGAAAPTITVGYTNEANTAGRTATNYVATANSPAVGSFYPIGLQAGDKGVRSVQSLTLSASWVSGTMNLVAYRVLGAVCANGYAKTAIADIITGCLPRLYAGSVPFLLFVPATNNSSGFAGSVGFTHG